MSSLKDQLAQVADNNATISLDRKRRQKIHGASLIYNPKTAVTQDYDFIFENAISGLDDLIEIDPRFRVFKRSLFNHSSTSIDRNTQTKDQIKDLDNVISTYLMLASSKWNLTPMLYATEWLIRRFQIHIHNAELLLLSTINHYQLPVFKKIMNIVKLPPLFNPLSNFVKNKSLPSNPTIVKLFNDMDFLKLYIGYMNKNIKQKFIYTNQLLFTTCSVINLVAFNSNNEEKLNKLVPLLLEMSANLLASDFADCQIAAHTILIVFSTALPLNKDIIIAATETILSNLTSESVKRSALIAICKLFQTLRGKGNVDQLPPKIYRLFDSKFELDYLKEFLGKNGALSDKFFTTYIRAITRYDHKKLTSIVSILKMVKLHAFEVRFIITDLIHLSEIMEDKTQLIELFEYFVSINEDLVLECLNSLNLTGEVFEIRLTTSLFSLRETIASSVDDIMKELEVSNVRGSNSTVPSFKEFLGKRSEYIFTKNESALIQDDDNFSKLLSLFLEAIGNRYQPGLFLSSFFTTIESKITFLLRLLVSPASPVALRLIALSNMHKLINNIDTDSNLFTLVPLLIVVLSNGSRNVRLAVRRILIQILKRPFTKHYFLSNRIYGSGLNIPMLSPKDGEAWLKNFLDEYIIDNYEFSSFLVPKKNEKMFLLFWANQIVHIPLPFPRTILLQMLTTHNAYSSSYTHVFENFIKGYLSERTAWELKCVKNKTNFDEFERAVVSIIPVKEKNSFFIDFIEEALKSDHERLAIMVSNKLIEIYPTLKSTYQLQLVQSIIEATSNTYLRYDSLETLQSLPLSADIFVSILTQNKIIEDEQHGLIKRRRRTRSATNKTALQKEEIFQIAEIYLKKLTIILETLDTIKPTGTETLLNTLLNVLSDLEVLDKDGGLPILYIQETLASCMLNTIESLKGDKNINLKSFRADILVSSIRASPSPQVQNKLLLAIGSLATLSSETVLHSIMPIFTFMGAHTIRQDDEFSTLVVEKTVKTVIPALLQSGSSNLTDEIDSLLISFCGAFVHIPKHRRVKLFTTLIQTLGVNKSIASFLFLMSKQYSGSISNFRITDSRVLIEFTKSFMDKFNVLEQITAINGFFDLIKILPVTKVSEDDKTLIPRVLFAHDILNYTESELFVLRKNLLDFIDKILTDDVSSYYSITSSLRLKALSAMCDSRLDNAVKESIRTVFNTLLRNNLDFISNLDEYCSHMTLIKNEESFDLEIDDYMKDMKDILFKLLKHILDLLPIDDFVKSALPLLDSTNTDAVRLHLTVLIAAKFDSKGIESVSIANKVIHTLFENITSKDTSSALIQASFNTLSSLIDKFDDKLDPSLFTESLKISTSNLLSDHIEIVIASLSTLTNIIKTIGVKSIAFYSKIVPPVLKIFQQSRVTQYDQDNLKEQLELSIVLLFASMIKRLPSFLLSNLTDVLIIIFFSGEVQDSIKLSVISLIVEQIELKDVLKALNRVWISDISTTTDSVAVSLFLSSLESTIESIDKKSATTQSPVFFKLLLLMFEYRSISKFDANTIGRIEASVYQIANGYVLKLNDKVFRPLFALIVKWAFDGEGVTNTHITKEERLISFFKFFGKLQENLKSIITSYFTYLIEPTNNLMKTFIKDKSQDINLRRLVLNSLALSFKYDKDGYWKSTSRFELISSTLIDQLVNIQDVIGKYLVKSISSLASNNAGIDEHNKVINQLLISHMKSSCTKTEKMWAAKSIKLIYSKVGEHWLVLLPQLVPVIAELLEDDDEEIEHEIRTGLVKVVENVLGEPFDRYLS